MSRCKDMQACDAQRKLNVEVDWNLKNRTREGRRKLSAPLVGACIVVFRGNTANFHVFVKVGCLCGARSPIEIKDDDGKVVRTLPAPPCDCIGWELVSGLHEATVFQPDRALEFQKKWGGVATQKPKPKRELKPEQKTA